MAYEEIQVTHDGYTDTAYSTCGDVRCSMAVLAAVGLSAEMMATHGVDLPEEVFELPVGEDTQVTCARLGETGSDEWCAACGEFLHHGIDCECPDKDVARTDLDRPHIDLAEVPEIVELWRGQEITDALAPPDSTHLLAKAAELEADAARAESDADPADEELYRYADAAHAESYWANQALPIEERYPADRFGRPEGDEQ